MDELNAHLDQLKKRKKNIQMITDQVGGWSKRVGKKLAEQLDEVTVDTSSLNMLAQFRHIQAMVTTQLKVLQEQREKARADNGCSDSDEESMNIKDLVNDFANEEFVQKNVRVRPVSSTSHVAGKADHESKIMTAEEEEEKKFNSEAQYDMVQQRKVQKERRKQEEIEKQLEAERAEKKKLRNK